jgi:MULE transposase domain
MSRENAFLYLNFKFSSRKLPDFPGIFLYHYGLASPPTTPWKKQRMAGRWHIQIGAQLVSAIVLNTWEYIAGGHKFFPMVFILASGKSEAPAEEMNTKLKPELIMTDFEMGAINAFRKHFPASAQKACIVHLKRNVFKRPTQLSKFSVDSTKLYK